MLKRKSAQYKQKYRLNPYTIWVKYKPLELGINKGGGMHTHTTLLI